MVNTGIYRPPCSRFASPLHMVPKKEPNDWTPREDYRKLNAVTTRDCYPLPQLSDFNLFGKKVFSKLDLVKAYLQIPIHSDDIKKTAVTTRFGLYEFPRMPSGLRNAGQKFQRFMNSVFLRSWYGFCFCRWCADCFRRYWNPFERCRSCFGSIEEVRAPLFFEKVWMDVRRSWVPWIPDHVWRTTTKGRQSGNDKNLASANIKI